MKLWQITFTESIVQEVTSNNSSAIIFLSNWQAFLSICDCTVQNSISQASQV